MKPAGSTVSRVEEFFRHFEAQIEGIASVQSPFYRKILYSVLLEAMARKKYPSQDDGDRLLRMLDTSSSWRDKDRVSLPQLELHFDVMFSAQEKKRSRLWAALQDCLQQGNAAGSSGDPFLYELQDRAVTEEYPALGLSRYLSLFMAYRKSLLQDFHITAAKEPPEERTVPYYVHYEQVWRLEFPAGFFRELALSCLKNLREYLLRANHSESGGPDLPSETGGLR